MIVLSLALAATPTSFTVPVQGQIADPSGVPLDGVHSVAFTLLGGASGTDVCHTATTSVLFDRGTFAAEVPFTFAQVCDFEGLSLQVSVDGGVASDPSPVGWAVRAAWAATAGEAAEAEHAALADRATAADDADLFGGLATTAFGRWATGVAQGLGIANRVVVTDATGRLDAVVSLPVANGGTGGTSAAAARANLGAAASGANGDITSLTGLTTAIALASGGTGATSAEGAFGNLSPQTTKGDLIGRAASGAVRVPVGADGQVLTASSASATGLAWATPAGAASQISAASSAPATCNTGAAGALYFDTTLAAARVCNGTEWVGLGGSGSGLPGTSAEAAYPSCEAIYTARPSSGNGLYWIDPTGGLTSDAFQAWCMNDIVGGGWTLAMNLDTADGNIRHWHDGFWANTNTVGAPASAMTADYRNQTLFSQPIGELMVVVHREGVPLGWRAWQTSAQVGMDQYFRHEASYAPGTVTTSSFANNVTGLSANEAFVRPEGQLAVNVKHGLGTSPDWARLRNSGLSTGADNAQFGIGSWMDSNSGLSYPMCEAGSMLAWDAYFCIGTDRSCPGNCGQTTGGARDLDYDYAFFTRSATSLASADLSLLGNSAGTAAASCNALKAARPTAPSGTYWLDNDAIGSGAAAYQSRCEQTLHGGGWTLAMNLDTSDGNVRSWPDTAFWTGAGGTGAVNTALSGDYKDAATYARSGFTQVMIVVHREGLQTVGWRGWNLANTSSLQTWFANALSTNPATMTASVTGGDVANLSGNETVVRPADNLRVNMQWGAGGSPDYARIRNNATPNTDNGQFALGSWMDANTTTHYPGCEAGAATGWSSNFCFGTDRICTGNCGSADSAERDLHYDYAIYLR